MRILIRIITFVITPKLCFPVKTDRYKHGYRSLKKIY